jgi:Tfp pilus assembly protein PilO
MRPSSHHIWKFAASGLTILFIGIMGFVFLPYSAHVYEKYSVLDNQSDQIEMMGNWQDQLKNIQYKKGKLDQGIDQMVVEIISVNEFSTAIELLYEKAQNTYVSIARVQPANTINSRGYIKRTIEVDLTGSYHSIARFINNLERSQMLIDIMSLTVEKTNQSTATLEAKLLVTFTMSEGGL